MPLFHTRVAPPVAKAAVAGAPVPQQAYQFSAARFMAGLGLVVLPVVPAFVAWGLDWKDAATAFLHMFELAFGGLVGLVVGERVNIGS